jgi:hypothetical protein
LRTDPNFDAHSNRNGNAMNARIEPADWVLANNSGNTVIQRSAFHQQSFFCRRQALR